MREMIYTIPKCEKGSDVCYLAYTDASDSYDGASSDRPKKTIEAVLDVVGDGGVVIVSGKGYFFDRMEVSAGATLKFTAVSPDGTDHREASPEYGAIMWAGGRTLSFFCDVIFEHINIYSRSTDISPLRISGGATAVFDDVRFKVQNSAHIKTALVIDASATAVFLGDNTGHLSSITGEGTLVVDKRLVDNGRITRAMTADFVGVMCDLDGRPLEFPEETGKERLHPKDVYSYGTYTDKFGYVIPYRYYLPQGYDPSKKYPIVLYMHGNGSRGTDNERHLRSDGAVLHNFIFRSEYDAIILAPQCTDASMWCNIKSAAGSAKFFEREMGAHLRAANELYDKFVSEHSVDTDRQYFIGMSCGGAAAWELMYYYPSKFTAAIPISGALEWDGAQRYARSAVGDTAVWTFHGTADKVCDVNATRALYSELSKAGRNIRYTEIKGDSHSNIWVDAAEETGIVDWLFSQSKAKIYTKKT